MRYWSIGDILGYGVVAFCAIAWYTVPSTTSSAIPSIAIAPIFLCIVSLFRMSLFCQPAIDLGFSAISSFASGECFAQHRLPARAELLGDFGIRHEEVKSMKSATHDQEFGCDSGMDESPCVLHVFFGE